MKDAPAIYLGRVVSKKNFRTYIYCADGISKLVESWDDFEKHMETGIWFASKKEALDSILSPIDNFIETLVVEKKAKRGRVKKSLNKKGNQDNEMINDERFIENDDLSVNDPNVLLTKDDNFLPVNEAK